MTAPMTPAAPICDLDLYSDAAILDPYELYARIRHAGPVVWLPRKGIYAIGRYGDVVAALRDHATFSSAAGVAVSETTNAVASGTLLASDPPEHDRLRKIVAAPLKPSSLTAMQPAIAAAADALVDALVARGSFDAATDLAQHLPLTIVSHMVGLPEHGRANMLAWASATFDAMGPENDRARAARPALIEMRGYVEGLIGRDKVKTGSWADRLLDHVASGAIPSEQFATLLRDYLGPSLDTTIFATANLIWLFACFPDQWTRLRAEPGLIRNAINEAVRLESPIRGFTRKTTRAVEIGGVPLPAGARVLLLYASANRDERKWDQADRFDIGRKISDQVGFGFGVHSCVGMNLARLEIESLLVALLPQVSRFEIGTPVRALNNTLRGFASLPVTVHP